MKSISSLFTSASNHWKTFVCEQKDFRTSRHVVVFESDDWGSIRMSNKKAWDELLKMGYAVDKRPYERFDTLESADDLEALFDVLSKYKDYNGNHPIITANMLMANPNFERIKESGYQQYYYESITKTYERYYGNIKVLELMRQGLSEGVFMPQCHGREHFNVAEWMQGLQAGDEDLLTAFRFGMCGIAPKAHPELGNQMMKALYAETEKEQQQIDAIVKEGLRLFEQFWGFKSKSFIAPCYCWSESSEKALADSGVELIQSWRSKKAAYQSPVSYYYTGQRNKYNQSYSVRNCSFDPSTKRDDVKLDALMKQVDNCFSNHKIAIFENHRINYASGIDKQNRDNTLLVLDKFIGTLIKRFPDVEFISSDKLINLFKK